MQRITAGFMDLFINSDDDSVITRHCWDSELYFLSIMQRKKNSVNRLVPPSVSANLLFFVVQLTWLLLNASQITLEVSWTWAVTAIMAGR